MSPATDRAAANRPSQPSTERARTVANHKVRTTINPDQELTVDDAELADLKAQGLIHDSDKPSEKKEATK